MKGTKQKQCNKNIIKILVLEHVQGFVFLLFILKTHLIVLRKPLIRLTCCGQQFACNHLHEFISATGAIATQEVVRGDAACINQLFHFGTHILCLKQPFLHVPYKWYFYGINSGLQLTRA